MALKTEEKVPWNNLEENTLWTQTWLNFQSHEATSHSRRRTRAHGQEEKLENSWVVYR